MNVRMPDEIPHRAARSRSVRGWIGFVHVVVLGIASSAGVPETAAAQSGPTSGGAAQSWWGDQPPAVGDGEWMRLRGQQGGRTRWLAVRGDRIVLAATPVLPTTRWFVRSLGPNLVRLESWGGRQARGLAVDGQGGLGLRIIGSDPSLLWRIAPLGPNGWVLENVGRPDSLLGIDRGAPAILPWSAAGAVAWVPTVIPAPIGLTAPVRIVGTRWIPHPPPPPVRLQMSNGHKYALLVLIGDSRDPSRFEKAVVEPGDSIERIIQREPGATLVEEVELWTPYGAWERQRFETQIPSAFTLDFSVYEKFLQSVAVDATGKSPNRIEDVNYVPKSVGRFAWIVDESLPQVVRIDVYERALAANNPGAVRKLDPREWEEAEETDSPLERVLHESQPPPRRKF